MIRVGYGLYDHVGLINDYTLDGERMVLSFSQRADGLEEMTLSEFAAGRPVFDDRYFGGLPPPVVMHRARSLVDKNYVWFVFNCEHFVRYAHDVVVESPQLQAWGAVAGLAVFALALSRS